MYIYIPNFAFACVYKDFMNVYFKLSEGSKDVPKWGGWDPVPNQVFCWGAGYAL